jgi:NitT/TauT family transport system ATP-binding protein
MTTETNTTHSSSVRVRGLRKSFLVNQNGQATVHDVLGGIDLDVAPGEFVSFFGPNGCGKTTFLTILAGLIEPNEGSISINSSGTGQSRIGFIFQNYRESLYPWLRNIDNIAFPLELHGVGKQERREQARQLIERLGLDLPPDGYPYQLSGGQQQLLSIARALIFNADVLVMDEPFASLDYSTRFSVRDRVQDIWLRTKTTTLFVSHSIEEAIYLADRLVLFSQKPMRVIDEIPILLPRPRHSSIMEHDDFYRIQAHALKIFNEEMSR